VAPTAFALALLFQVGPGWQDAPALPRPVTNNAVVGVETSAGPAVFSFLGLDASKTSAGVVTWAFRWDVGSAAWREVAPVPGPGRLAATAQAVGGRVYVFGGYTVEADGSERSLPNVDVYDPMTDTWSTGEPVPVPVDDAVSGVWNDRLIFLVSGWHDTGNETAVQIYDPERDVWSQGTPLPGSPVFGHAGAIARNTIVYVDGVTARPRDQTPAGESRFSMEASSWRGEIDPSDPTRVTWLRLPDHPGPGLYRAAAVSVGTRVVFLGGSRNPYNYDGIGYDGRPSEPEPLAFSYDVVSGAWSTVPAPRAPTMDHRAAIRVGGYVALAGGMEAGQTVTSRVRIVPVIDLIAGGG
jgi:hypothetical protein